MLHTGPAPPTRTRPMGGRGGCRRSMARGGLHHSPCQAGLLFALACAGRWCMWGGSQDKEALPEGHKALSYHDEVLCCSTARSSTQPCREHWLPDRLAGVSRFNTTSKLHPIKVGVLLDLSHSVQSPPAAARSLLGAPAVCVNKGAAACSCCCCARGGLGGRAHACSNSARPGRGNPRPGVHMSCAWSHHCNSGHHQWRWVRRARVEFRLWHPASRAQPAAVCAAVRPHLRCSAQPGPLLLLLSAIDHASHQLLLRWTPRGEAPARASCWQAKPNRGCRS